MTRGPQRGEGPRDPVAQLTHLFAEHAVWRKAARHIDPSATSDVYFSDHPGRAWHIERLEGVTRLLPGRSTSPDFAFRFTPRSVRRLSEVDGGIGGFARVLFELMLDPDPEARIDIRIVASFSDLRRRGYVRLLLAGGPALVAFGARHGVRGLGELRKLVRSLRSTEPAPWECAR